MNFKKLIEQELDPEKVVKALSGNDQEAKKAKQDILTKLVKNDNDEDNNEEKDDEEKKAPEIKSNINKNNDPIGGNKTNKVNKITSNHSRTGSVNSASWLNKKEN
jgi:hypothetical protein